MVALDDRTGNILTTIVVYAAIVVAAYLARSTLGVFLLALLLAYLLEPSVAAVAKLMSRSSHGRAIAIAVVYAGLTATLIVVGYAFGPSVAAQIRRFVAAIPEITGRIDKALPGGHTDLVSPVAARATGAVVNAAEGIAWLFLVPIVAIFFLGNRSGLLQSTADLFGRGSDVAAAKRTIDQVDRALAEYARAQLILATLTGVFYSAAMALLGFPYPLALGALAGALEFIPAFGWIAAAIAILVTGWAAHAHWIVMAVLIGVWRLVQNFVNSPRVMGDHLQMNPMLVLFAMMAGGQLAGLTGIVASLPAVAVVRILWTERRAKSSQSNVAVFKSQALSMQGSKLLLAVGVISSLAGHPSPRPLASTSQRLNAVDGPSAFQTVHRDPPTEIFTSFGLTPDQVAAVDAGKPIARVLSWGTPLEVYVFGAVHIDGSPDVYVKAARDVARLRGTEGYLGIGELTEDTSVADLAPLSLDPDDVKALKNCREGSCDVQLPTASIQTFHDEVNWSRPDTVDQANALARPMVLRLVSAYREGGNETLGEYRDKQNPARIADQFRTMVGRASALPDVLPELRRYLLEYPNAELADADSFFYWEKVSFGMKPTIRVNHGVTYRRRTDAREIAVVAIKQLYASHYFHTALDMSVCVDDRAAGAAHGFYLLTVKGSQQEGLTGAKGSMLRKIVVDKTRGSLESALASIKRSVEQASRPH